ncbi:hypothetical protein DL96DRAFT_1719060 [Flagelloscypha sp. PMI_526]|nr:hypothetical protein DL96DRAFT_1719060 [Flagelloscypha sp. PMI_526]
MLFDHSRHRETRALPRIYYNFDLSPRRTPRTHIAGAVERQRLVQYATPNSLAHTKQLQCWIYNEPFSLAPFRNLSHLLFWGTQRLTSEMANVMLDLALEELFIWSFNDVHVLHTALTISLQSKLQDSLRRYGFYAPNDMSLQKGIRVLLPNATHLFVLCESVDSHVLLKPSLGDFQCCIFHFPFTLEQHNPLSSLRDRRVVFAQDLPRQFTPKQFVLKRNFWVEQARMWKNAEMSIAQNSDPQTLTMMEQFPG